MRSAALGRIRDDWALAWTDISTGALHVLPVPGARIGPELARLNPSELAVPGSAPQMFEKAAQSDVDVIFLDLEDAVAEAVDPDEVVDAEADTAGLEPGKPCCSAMD